MLRDDVILRVAIETHSDKRVWNETHSVDTAWLFLKAITVIVSSPDQIFRVRPVDSSKNRVWTLSLRKLGQVYVWRAVNWVIVTVGVN